MTGLIFLFKTAHLYEAFYIFDSRWNIMLFCDEMHFIPKNVQFVKFASYALAPVI